jgi:preprotein translocase subunit YajC
MTIALAISIYTAMIATVVSIVVYYFRVIRPKDEEQLK